MSKHATTSPPARAPQKNGASAHTHGPHCCNGAGAGRLSCEVRIRLYVPQDFKALNAIWKAGDMALDDTDTAEAMAENLQRFKNSYRVFVAEAQMVQGRNGAVGRRRLAGGVVTAFDGHRASVYHLAVHPEFRGVGLGRALLDTCERQAKIWGARHLRLTARTDASRAAARRMYAKAGWEVDSTICVYRKTLH